MNMIREDGRVNLRGVDFENLASACRRHMENSLTIIDVISKQCIAFSETILLRIFNNGHFVS